MKPRIPDEAMKTAFPRLEERVMIDQLELVIPVSSPSIEMQRRVRPTELDLHEHVNHTAYVAWIEDLDLPIRRVHIRFEKDARPNDELIVRAWFDRSRGVVDIRRGEERILSAAIA